MPNKILLSFDVEEFDIPLEYNYDIGVTEQMEIGNCGLTEIAALLETEQISCTLFTTANFANHFPEAIKKLAQHHEIASHTYYHSDFKTEDLLLSKKRLEEISGQPIRGLRMPRMREVNMQDVLSAGYKYDSSINPTLVPGRYNKLRLPRTPYQEQNILRFPTSVSPHLRIPLFWLAFKNYPYQLFLKLCIQCLKRDGHLCLYFHPWEFTNIEGYKIPLYMRRYNGPALTERLQRLIRDLKNHGEYDTIYNYCKQKGLL